MKKFLVCVLALVTLVVCTVTVAAEGVDFVSSITNKGAPELVYTENGAGEKVIGQLVDKDGNVVSEECLDHIIITSVSDAPNSDEISEEAKKLLLDLYEELSETGTKLSEVCPGLNDLVEDALGKGKNADDLVVRDLFDISGHCDELTALPKDGQSIELTFDLGLGKDEYAVGMIYVDGAWKPLNMKNNGDGTFSAKFEQLGPVAFMVPGADKAPSAPTTGEDHSGLIFWGAMLTLSAVAIVLLVVFSRKKVEE